MITHTLTCDGCGYAVPVAPPSFKPLHADRSWMQVERYNVCSWQCVVTLAKRCQEDAEDAKRRSDVLERMWRQRLKVRDVDMPVTPNAGESEQDFMSRCLRSETGSQQQRFATCIAQWNKRPKQGDPTARGALVIRRDQRDDA